MMVLLLAGCGKNDDTLKQVPLGEPLESEQSGDSGTKEQEEVADWEVISREPESGKGQSAESEPESGTGTGSKAGLPQEIETKYARGSKIEAQSFDITIQPLGEVTFSSYEPDTKQDPLADAVFLIEKDGRVIQELEGVTEDNCRANQQFYQVEAVAFFDYNLDNFEDIIVICSYSFASGPQAGEDYSEVRYYTGSDSGTFSYQKQLSEDACSALSVITVDTARGFLGFGPRTNTEEP